jgi:hypothetical protein
MLGSTGSAQTRAAVRLVEESGTCVIQVAGTVRARLDLPARVRPKAFRS